jgi:hypothetical protein
VKWVNWWVRVGLSLLMFVAAHATAYAQEHSQVQSLRASGDPVPQGGSGGSAASGGDLWIELSCDGGAWADDIEDDWVYLQMWLFVEGQQVAYNLFPARGEAYGNLTVSVRASTIDRRVECDVSGSYSSASASGTILGSGPGSMTVKIAAFIPYEWVGNPWNTFRIFEGDNRSFSYTGPTSRVDTIIDVFNPAVNDADILDGPYHNADLTIEYEASTSLDAPMPFGHITQAARDDWIYETPMKTRWAFSDTSGNSCDVQRLGAGPGYSRQQLHCIGAASNPVVMIGADIDWDLTFVFKYGFNKVEYSVTGCTDGFPAYEAYANGTPLFQAEDSHRVDDLMPPCDRSIDQSGVIQ